MLYGTFYGRDSFCLSRLRYRYTRAARTVRQYTVLVQLERVFLHVELLLSLVERHVLLWLVAGILNT